MIGILAEVSAETVGLVGGLCIAAGAGFTALANYYRTRKTPGNGNGKPAVDEVARTRLDYLEGRDLEMKEDKRELWGAVDDIRKSSSSTATSAAVIAERTQHLPCVTDGRGCPERNLP
jgi:hypothetical protein